MERRSTTQRDEWIRRISLAPDQMYQHEQNNNSGKVRISTFILEDICHIGKFLMLHFSIAGTFIGKSFDTLVPCQTTREVSVVIIEHI